MFADLVGYPSINVVSETTYSGVLHASTFFVQPLNALQKKRAVAFLAERLEILFLVSVLMVLKYFSQLGPRTWSATIMGRSDGTDEVFSLQLRMFWLQYEYVCPGIVSGSGPKYPET